MRPDSDHHAAADWYEPTQALVHFFRQLEMGMRELTLDLSGIGLTSVPIPVIDLTHLTSLSLSKNRIPQLPLALVELSKLVVLNVQENLEMEWMTQEAVQAPEHYVLQVGPLESPCQRFSALVQLRQCLVTFGTGAGQARTETLQRCALALMFESPGMGSG